MTQNDYDPLIAVVAETTKYRSVFDGWFVTTARTAAILLAVRRRHRRA